MVHIWYMELIFQNFHYLSTCPLVHTFWHDFKGLRKKKKTWNRKTASCPHVHTFCKYLKGYKKERKHEIEGQLIVHMSTLCNNDIHGVDFFSEYSELVHLSTIFEKIWKSTRKKENMKWKDSFFSTFHTFEKWNTASWFFFSESSKLVHLSTLFSKNLKGTRKKENMKHKNSFLSTYPHFWIMKYVQLSLKFSEFSELVHLSTIFAKHFGGYKKEIKKNRRKERNHEMTVCKDPSILLVSLMVWNTWFFFQSLSTCPHFLQKN